MSEENPAVTRRSDAAREPVSVEPAGPSAPAPDAPPPVTGGGDAGGGGGPGPGGPGGGGPSDPGGGPSGGGSGAAPAARGRARGVVGVLREVVVLFAVAVVIALVIKTFLVQAFFIPSGSMEKTLHGCSGCSGDRVLVNKLTYRVRDPKQGDIVVFRGPESWTPEVQYAPAGNPVQRLLRAVGSTFGVSPPSEKDFVKRVIAVGGQKVKCCDAQGRVTVDGRPLNEPYVYVSDPSYKSAPFEEITVPQGRLWMMGDHRDQSFDSRGHISDADHGTIGVSDVVGKAFVIVWPPSRWDTLGSPSTYAAASGGGPPVGAPVTGAAAVGVPFALGLGVAAPVRLAGRRRRRRAHRGR